MQYTKEDIIYLAGIIDGEGCISLHSNGSSTVLLVVANTNKNLMTWLHKKFEGTICIGTSSNIKSKIGYYWYCQQKNIIEILVRIIPFLLIKKEQAKLAIKYRNLISSHHRILTQTNKNKRKEIICKLHRLNKKGRVYEK